MGAPAMGGAFCPLARSPEIVLFSFLGFYSPCFGNPLRTGVFLMAGLLLHPSREVFPACTLPRFSFLSMIAGFVGFPFEGSDFYTPRLASFFFLPLFPWKEWSSWPRVGFSFMGRGRGFPPSLRSHLSFFCARGTLFFSPRRSLLS